MPLTIPFRTDLNFFRTDLKYFRTILKWIMGRKIELTSFRTSVRTALVSTLILGPFWLGPFTNSGAKIKPTFSLADLKIFNQTYVFFGRPKDKGFLGPS